jgi:hypothetical protein
MRLLSLKNSRGLDRAWLAALGLLACGPLPPMDDSGATTSDDPTATSTTDPTTSPTGFTTFPPPGCEPGSSCGFCSTCGADGSCLPDLECCLRSGVDASRCQPPPECYGDDDCPFGYVCDDYDCSPIADEALPPCGLPAAIPSQWDLSQPPASFDLADLDGDGDLDLFAALPAVAAVELAFNDGAGNFTGGTLVDAGPPQTDISVVARDFGGDAAVDLAIARRDGSDVMLLFGQDGEFVPGPLLPASRPPRSLTAVDVDIDDVADLVAIGDEFGSVSLWLGDGLGGFSSELSAPDLVDSVDATVIVDVDPDGIPAILSLAGQQMLLFRGVPGGLWQLQQSFELSTGGWSQALAARLGGGPVAELVVVRAEPDGGLARVWRGLEPGAWDTPSNFLTAAPLTGGRFADVTGDGVLDLVSATGSATVAVLVGDGAGGFACEQLHEVAADSAPDVIATGDVDGDGRTDIVAGTRDGLAVTVLRP